MDRDIDGLQSIFYDVLNIRVLHIGERHIISLEETETRVIVFKIECVPHSSRHLIDEAKNTAV